MTRRGVLVTMVFAAASCQPDTGNIPCRDGSVCPSGLVCRNGSCQAGVPDASPPGEVRADGPAPDGALDAAMTEDRGADQASFADASRPPDTLRSLDVSRADAVRAADAPRSRDTLAVPDACTTCGSSCVDLQTDPMNCGGCGLVCPGGKSCVAAACVCPSGTNYCVATSQCMTWSYDDVLCGPADKSCGTGNICGASGGTACEPTPIPTTLVASSPGGVVALALDANNVYWLAGGSNGTVMQMPLAGGAPVTLQTGQTNPSSIAVDSTYVYWTVPGAGVIEKTRIGVPGGAVGTLASGQPGVGNLTLSTSNAYWTTSSPAPGTIMEVPLAGGTPLNLLAVGGGPGNTGSYGPSALFVTPSGIFYGWAASLCCVVPGCRYSSALLRIPAGGGTPVMVASGLDDNPGPMVSDGISLYWTAMQIPGQYHPMYAIMKMPLAGGAVTGFGPPGTSDVAIDATSIYWTSYSTGTYPTLKMPLCGGAIETLATASYIPGPIAVGSSNAYWGYYTSGQLVTMTK